MLRRSSSMSQCVRGGLIFFGSGAAPSTSLASLPCNRHSQIMGDSASSANDTVKSWFLGQA